MKIELFEVEDAGVSRVVLDGKHIGSVVQDGERWFCALSGMNGRKYCDTKRHGVTLVVRAQSSSIAAALLKRSASEGKAGA